MAYFSVFAVVLSKLKRLLGNNGNSKKKKKESANREFFLPRELLVLILSRLSLKDNICASVVCKTWHEVALSLRDRSPWFLYFDSDLSGISYGFYDPVQKKKTKATKLRFMSFYASICYSKDGWLLIEDIHKGSKILYFFNPFTGEYKKIPSLRGNNGKEFAFSCAPTNKSCVVCCISNRSPYSFLIHTWYLGEVEWVTKEFPRPASFIMYRKKNIVFSDGCFWFADRDGLGVFNPIARTWTTLHVPLPSLDPFLIWITEHKGNMFLVDVINNGRRPQLVVFRLNRSRLVWEKKKTFDGFSIFVSDESNITTYGLAGDMSNIVYVWESQINSERPCKYSLYTRSCCTDPDGYYVKPWSKYEWHFGAWIEPPQDISIYDFTIIGPSLMPK